MKHVVYVNAGLAGPQIESAIADIVQGSKGNVIQLVLMDMAGAIVDIDGYTITGVIQNRHKPVEQYAITGVCAPGATGTGEFTWILDILDTGVFAEWFVFYTFSKVASPLYRSNPVKWEVTQYPGATTTPGNPTETVPADNAAWLSRAILTGLEFDDHIPDAPNLVGTAYGREAEAWVPVLQRDILTVAVASGRNLLATDASKILECTGTFTLTCPNGLDPGFQCLINNVGTGTITISAAGTLQSKDSAVQLANQHGLAGLYHRGGDVWNLSGDIS